MISETRSGYINAFTTGAPPCSASTWPRFHHDNANSGDYGRDATLPGAPFGLSSTPTQIRFRAPGDDLLCRSADHYQVVTSNARIDETNFQAAQPLSGAPAPAAPGVMQTYAVPGAAKRYVAIRAVDEAGNVGRPATVDLG